MSLRARGVPSTLAGAEDAGTYHADISFKHAATSNVFGTANRQYARHRPEAREHCRARWTGICDRRGWKAICVGWGLRDVGTQVLEALSESDLLELARSLEDFASLNILSQLRSMASVEII